MVIVGKADEFEHLRTDVKTYQQQRLDNIDGFQAVSYFPIETSDDLIENVFA